MAQFPVITPDALAELRSTIGKPVRLSLGGGGPQEPARQRPPRQKRLRKYLTLTPLGGAGMVVEDFNNGRLGMATMNFSVPDDVKAAFEKAFAGTNKSAVLTRLMRDAIEAQARQQRRARAINRLLVLRRRLPSTPARVVRAARVAGRP